MRYQKSPLDVKREYVEIQKSILRSYALAESWFLSQNVSFGAWEI